MLRTILNILLGTSFKKAGMGKEYRLAKTGVRYLYNQTNSSAGRSNSNSTKPITENQILEFKKLQKRVDELENLKISETQFDVYQKVRREEDRRTFQINLVEEKFENIDPKYLDRGDYHFIKNEIQKKILKDKKEKKLQIERDLNLKKYGKSETNRQRTLRLNTNQRASNFKKYGIQETNAERKKREQNKGIN
jgi:hypothetical protein